MKDLLSRGKTIECFDEKAFRQTDTLLQPAYAWIWNAPVSREEIAGQLDAMSCAGIRTVYVLPEPKEFRPYNERVHLEPEYLTEAYFDMLRFAINGARERGMSVWLYDEGGWPSGSACGRVLAAHPELCRKGVAMRTISLHAGDIYEPDEHALAAFSIGPDGARRMVAAHETVETDVDVDEYYVHWEGGLSVNALEEDVGRSFVESTHERHTRFLGDLFGVKDANGCWVEGSGCLQLMFTDEPGAGRFAWPCGFEKRFLERYGYDIRPFLPDLMDMEREAEGEALRARMDYRELTGEMFRDNYFRPLREWAHRYNTLSAGHLDIDHQSDGCLYHHYGTVLQQLREMDIPGVDVIWHQITRPTADGKIADLSRQTTPSDSDASKGKACAEGNGFFPRFASSAAAQAGGKYALSESFAVYGGGLDGDEMRFVVNFQLVRGINVFNFMSMSYARDCAAGLLMRPDFVPEMPGYEHLRGVNDYTARASYLMQLGRPGVDTALYYPARDIWAGGETARRAAAAFDNAGHLLEEKQVDFDIIDDEVVRLAQAEGGALRLGLAAYSHVIIPDCRHMPEDVKDRLAAMDQAVCPALDVDCPALRVRRRMLPEQGTLWMLFNESDHEIAPVVSLPGTHVFRLSADTAEIERADGLQALALRPGEAQFFLSSEMDRDSVQDALRERQIVGRAESFTIQQTRKTTVDRNGLHSDAEAGRETACVLGGWAAYVGADFSGEVVYRTQIELDETPRPEDTYEIDLGHVECSARVRVNGKPIGIAWFHPMRLTFDGALLEGGRVLRLEIKVANTMANVCAAQPLETLFPKVELGPYQEKLRMFEAFAPKGGLYGPVTVSRLCQ